MEASSQNGLTQSDLQLLKDKIVLFLSKQHYTENTQADKDLNVSLVQKCSVAFEEKRKQDIKTQSGRYCPSGHLMFKTTYNSCSTVDSNYVSDPNSECKECNVRDWGFPYGWRCEVPDCFMICKTCYARQYGKAAETKYGQVWRYYDNELKCQENFPHEKIKPAICKLGHVLYKFPLKKTIDKKDSDFEKYKVYYYGTTMRKCTYCKKECLHYQWRCDDLSHGRMCDDCLDKTFGVEQSKIQDELSRHDRKQNQSLEESKTSTAIPKCKSNHVLAQLKGKIYPPTQQHNCSECNTENIDSSQCFWNCYKCSFDLCQGCAVQQYGEQILVKPKPKKATFDSVARTVGCEKGHILVRTTGSFPDLRKQVDCCLCAKFCLEREPYYWKCHDCKYDICHSCFKKNQINIDSDPQGKIARKAQKERNYRNIFMESLEKVKKEGGYYYQITAKSGYQLDCTEFLLAGITSSVDFGLSVYVKLWTQVFIEVLIDQIKLKDGKIREEMIGLCIYNQFLLTAQRAMAGKIQLSPTTYTMKEVSIFLLSKIATIFEKALTTVIEKNSDFKIKTPSQPCYFASQVYDKGDLNPYLQPLLTKEKQNIVKMAAEKAIPLQYKFNPQIIQLLGQFSIKGKPIYAQCKYGKKTSDVYQDYNHGIRRSEMKYLEELASKPENDFKSIASMRDYIVQTDIVDAEALINEYFKRMENWIKYILNNEPVDQYNETQIRYNNPVKTFCQQDILRCKAYYGSVDDIAAAIDSIKQQFPLVRIKNRMGFLGDVMVNFWYEDFVAEAQLVYFEENEGEDDHAMKLRNKVNHFMYEIVRNPLGPLVHCAELTFKEAISRLGYNVIRQYGVLNNVYRITEKVNSSELPLHNLPDGTEYYGKLKDGQKEGECKEYLPDGTYFEGEYRDGMKYGNGKIETLDGTVYKGRFHLDKRHGQGSLSYPNGYTIEGGYFENGVRNNKFKVYLKGVMYGEVNYVNDKPEGKAVLNWSDCKCQYTCNFVNGAIENGDFDQGCYRQVYHAQEVEKLLFL